jgi:hypothetical protein
MDQGRKTAISRKPCDSVESVLNNPTSWANGLDLNGFPLIFRINLPDLLGGQIPLLLSAI